MRLSLISMPVGDLKAALVPHPDTLGFEEPWCST
jgi:hypothetical protein